MKHLVSSVIALLLVVCTFFICACGTTTLPPVDIPPPTTQDPPNTQKPPVVTPPTPGVIDIYDPSLPMADLSSQISSYLYSESRLLQQPKNNVFPDSAVMRSDVISSFVEAEKIIARGRPDTPLYGIYTYTHEYLDNQDTAVRAGFTAARISSDGNGWNDTHQLALAESDMRIMTSCAIGRPFNETASKSYFLPQRQEDTAADNDANMRNIEYYDLAGWLIKGIDATREKIDRLGPEGSWWRDHPEVNYNPVRYYEYCNEPNFQYLIPVKKAGGADDANTAIKCQVYAIMQTCVYMSLKPIYGDSIRFVGVSAGGGANHLGQGFVSTLCSYTNNASVNEMLNNALNPDKIKQYVSPTDPSKNESDEAFAARQASVRKLREYMGLEDGETLTINITKTMDIMSTHPYMDGASPFSAVAADNFSQSRVIANMRANLLSIAEPGDEERVENMPIWFTECGWSIKGATAYAEAYPEDVANGIYGGQATETTKGASQILQAAMEVQDYLYGIRNGIDFISYMHMYDTDGCNFGLVNFGYRSIGPQGTNNKSPRLTMYSIGVMTELMPNPALKRVVHEGTIGSTGDYLFIYEIEADVGGEIVTTVFSPLYAVNASVPWEHSYALVTDMFGKSQIVKAADGYIHLEAGPYMLYLREVPSELLVKHGLSFDEAAVTEIFTRLSHAWREREETL